MKTNTSNLGTKVATRDDHIKMFAIMNLQNVDFIVVHFNFAIICDIRRANRYIPKLCSSVLVFINVRLTVWRDKPKLNKHEIPHIQYTFLYTDGYGLCLCN